MTTFHYPVSDGRLMEVEKLLLLLKAPKEKDNGSWSFHYPFSKGRRLRANGRKKQWSPRRRPAAGMTGV
jgi:hypothetical protein